MTDPSSPAPGAWASGLATFDGDGRVLDTWYPAIGLGTDPAANAVAPGTREVDAHEAGSRLGPDVASGVGPDDTRGVRVAAVATVVESLADPPVDAHDVWLRLHLLSNRLIAPHGANLDGLFGLLANVAWTSAGPVPVAGLDDVRMRCRLAGRPLVVHGIDKFPRMTDYVVPSGVRIADADRVRMGAHLAPGTTVMHEGFVNFNAGTLGTSMVEGRISAGVVVGDGSDIGGGASIQGTLSGGGKEVVSVGERCLLGANAGIGISLGDECIVEAGLYVTAGTRVALPDGRVAKARDLSGRSGLLFRRNSQSGAVEVLASGTALGELNADLHRND